ncbi:MAG: 50S ribosomal protein L5 [Patescibacteria group bacterium]|jgi:large subunit ribosomal protein L5
MRLQEKYNKEIKAALKEKFGKDNVMSVPKVTKIVLNIGASKALQDPKYLEIMESTLARISGQKPIKTRAKKSIAAFKIRQGMVVGFKVTLRGIRMWDFLEKLINVTMPRSRDFRGLDEKGFDGKGNYSLGFKEYIAFPEIRSDEVEKQHGLEVTIITTAKNDEEGFALLSALGVPFKKKEK